MFFWFLPFLCVFTIKLKYYQIFEEKIESLSGNSCFIDKVCFLQEDLQKNDLNMIDTYKKQRQIIYFMDLITASSVSRIFQISSSYILIYIKNMNNKYSKILNFINSKKNLMHTNAMHE